MVTLQDPVVEEVLYQGLSDYVALTVIRGLVMEEAGVWWYGDGPPDLGAVRRRTLDTCAFLLSDGLMMAGSLSNSTSDQTDFLDWPGSPAENLARIEREWDRFISLDGFEPCWFRSTPAGISAGKNV